MTKLIWIFLLVMGWTVLISNTYQQMHGVWCFLVVANLACACISSLFREMAK